MQKLETLHCSRYPDIEATSDKRSEVLAPVEIPFVDCRLYGKNQSLQVKVSENEFIGDNPRLRFSETLDCLLIEEFEIHCV